MTAFTSLLIASFYFVVAVAIAIHEYKIVTLKGGDSFTVVLAFVFIYLLLPSVGIYGLLGLYGVDLRTGNYFFDQVFSGLTFIDSLIVYFLTITFVAGLYIPFGFSRSANRTMVLPKKELKLKNIAVFVSLAVLMFICGKFFLDLGGDFLERYANLILFRNLDSNSVRTFFSANAFALTQTFAWLAAGVCFIYLGENKYLKAVMCFVLMLFAAFLMGSRRGLIFPVIIIYLGFVLLRKDLYLRKVIFLLPFFILWVSFGKELTGAIAYGVNYEDLLHSYNSSGSMALRAFSDIGISQMGSLAVLQHFESFPRFGIDHLLSILRRVPDGMMGLEIDWPERIVRKTTEAFASSEDADIGPGLIGQSWLDFPVVGAFVWGLFIGLQSCLLDRFVRGFCQSPTKIAFTVLVSIIIVLPINTGSLDFTFSVDVIILTVLLGLLFRSRCAVACSQATSNVLK